MSIYSDSNLTYLYELQNRGLTSVEVDNNTRLLFYSASLRDSGGTLRLHRDITDSLIAATSSLLDPVSLAQGDVVTDYTIPSGVARFIDIPLGTGGGSGITISGNTNNNVITATGTTSTLQGENNFKFNGSKILLTGSLDINSGVGEDNIFIGPKAGGSSSTTCTIALGLNSGLALTGTRNTVLGAQSLKTAAASSRTTAVGHCNLHNLTSGNFNTALGADAGDCVTSGNSNVLLGYAAGPSGATTLSNKLYINNSSGTPLICGDFSTGQVFVTSQVSASLFSGSFVGDGSNLTGLSTTAFPHNGNALITGSLTVSGSSVVVDFTNTAAVSASIFSGSFVGNGAGLTGITSNAFPHNGDAVITGSFTVSGSNKLVNLIANTTVTGPFTVTGSLPTINLNGITTVDNNIKIHSPSATSIGIGSNSLGTNTSTQNIGIGDQVANASRGTSIIAIGAKAGANSGDNTINIGFNTSARNEGRSNTIIGYSSLGAGSGEGGENVGLGCESVFSLSKANRNVGLGNRSIYQLDRGDNNSALGYHSLCSLTKGGFNTALGSNTAQKVTSGDCNVYIGYKAGPSTTNTEESNQLYINNNEGTPLIKGNFSTCQVEFRGDVTGSSFTGSFIGDGTNLTGVTAEWDGSRNGDANITGSFTVSGSSSIVDFTNTTVVSGSTFSGSFVGDGSGLSGLTGVEWDGSRNGNSNITGSLIVSGALDVAGTVTISSGSYPGGPGVELIQLNASSITSNTNLYSFLINASNGYTGFKADYTLTTANEASKKVGTVYGSWDRAGNAVVNDNHTVASGAVTATSFSVDASSTTAAIFKLNVPAGTFEINTLITAFKRVV